MLKKSVYDTIKQGFKNDIYKTVRLIKIDSEGKRICMLPFSKMGDLKHSFNRLDHIKFKLEKCEPGKYIIECATGFRENNHKDIFEVNIKDQVFLPITTGEKLEGEIIDKTEDQEQMNNISFEEYLERVKECEKLKAQNALLLTQLEMERRVKEVSTLNDSEPKTITEKVFKSLDDNLPMVLNIFDKFMIQRDKANELKERELNIKSGYKTMNRKSKVNPDEVVKELEELYDKDQNEFNRVLDELEQKNPNLYSYCCNALGLEESEELDTESEE